MHLTESNMYRSKINQLSRGFSAETKELIASLSDDELHRRLDGMITPPITLAERSDPEMLQLYYTSSYVHLMEFLNVPKDAKLFEIAAGDTIFIPKALDTHGEEGAKYVTANLNQDLTEGFRDKTAELSIEIQVIEDNGARILNYCGQGSMDVIVFHHALNDIVQTMIAQREGIDTIHSDWWSVEPQMLQAVMDYHNRGELKQAVYGEFISIIETCHQLLKEEGIIIFDNCIYAGYEKIGYSSEFHSNYIQFAREWINEADLGLQEVQVPGFDEKWWMVLQKSH
ncbi:hypothetical protein SAMN05661091_2218 [Paenibacillus uliginis N3/975]|uniref:Uncharacterized protein n=1 Tax=Paenibacillus uliginis N3/975 TaxID=1313296 RepID=A0A1X7HAI2_9BACL|nr:hypothetical protein [Paenibacillus uliginis]SMF82673.1 hypothetical protein SAMN05661091_2218 [Paenibacillus uliginis N3/975]